jgi:hypothetical protein
MGADRSRRPIFDLYSANEVLAGGAANARHDRASDHAGDHAHVRGHDHDRDHARRTSALETAQQPRLQVGSVGFGQRPF